MSQTGQSPPGAPASLPEPPERVPKQQTYCTILDQLSKTGAQPQLYSKVQYQLLSSFLQRTPPRASDHETFIHVVVHTFANDVVTTRQDFDLKDGLRLFKDSPKPEADATQVVFVRGSLSPAWIEALGIRYKIDPEFFRRHLRYLAGRDFSDLPSLPSASTEMLSLRLPTLYTRSNVLASSQLRSLRERDAEVARKNHQSISGDVASGETIVRRLSTLSERLFSIEHDISIFTRSRKSRGQIGENTTNDTSGGSRD